MLSKVIVFSEANKVNMKEINLPKPAAGQIVTKTLFSGFSIGTETRVLSARQFAFWFL